MTKPKKINLILVTLFVFILSTQTVFAKYKTLETIPGISKADFPSYVTGFYNFAIAFVLIAALLMITIGGFYYITSAGNQAQAGTAKRIITDALLGLVVVFSIWLVLNTINPDLINSANPNLSSLQNEVVPSVAPGRSVQRDVWCSSGTCYDNKQKCESSENNCKSMRDSFSDKKVYTKVDGKYVEYNGTYKECKDSGVVCHTGANLKNDLSYGVGEVESRNKLESDNTINVSFSASTSQMSNNDIQNLKNIAKEMNVGTGLTVEGASPDGKTIYTNLVGNKAEDYLKKNTTKIGKNKTGDIYYRGKVNGKEIIFVKAAYNEDYPDDDKILLPKNDGTTYTNEELGIIDSNDDTNLDEESIGA